MRKLNLVTWIILGTTLLSGCASQRLRQFEEFSIAGKIYAEAIQVLTEEAGNVAIDADSQLLAKDKAVFSIQDRKTHYVKRTKALEEFLSELRKFRKHSELLKKYFFTLSKLATSDASSGISENAGKLVESLQSISPSLKDATIGEAPVKDYLTQTVQLTVSVFQQKALEIELKKNAAVIERELDLQQAFLSALAIGLEADLKVVLKSKEYVEVAKPYIADGMLPMNWVENRRELISSVVVMGSVDNAEKAAKELKKAFVALVEKKIEPEDFAVLFEDINAMLDIVELVRDTAKETEG